MKTTLTPKEYIKKYSLNPHYAQAIGEHVLSSPVPRLSRYMNPFTKYMSLASEEELNIIETYIEYRLANERLYYLIFEDESW